MPNQVGSRNVATRNREVAILVVNASTNVFVKRRTYDGYVESVLNPIPNQSCQSGNLCDCYERAMVP